MGQVARLKPYIPLVGFDDPEELLMRWPGWTRRELETLCREPVSLRHTRFYRVYASFPRRAHWQRYSALLGSLPDDRVHQASRLTGLQVRFPFFDAGVRSLVESLDQGLRFLPGEPKRVLKAALARRVPRSLWDVPKHGFDFPFADLLAAQRFALVREYLDPARVAAWGLFDPEPVRQATVGLPCRRPPRRLQGLGPGGPVRLAGGALPAAVRPGSGGWAALRGRRMIARIGHCRRHRNGRRRHCRRIRDA